MKVYRTDEIRNVVLLGHGGSGKTSLVEAMAYVSGATNRLGTIDGGNTISDFDKEEQKRKFSTSTSLVPIEWAKAKINILDTPGYFDFVGEVEEAVSAADAAVIVVSGKAGVQVGTEKAWELCDKYNLPRMVYVTEMDVDDASFRQVVADLTEKYGKVIAPHFAPIRENEKLVGYVNVIKNAARRYTGLGMKVNTYRDGLIVHDQRQRISVLHSVHLCCTEMQLLGQHLQIAPDDGRGNIHDLLRPRVNLDESLVVPAVSGFHIRDDGLALKQLFLLRFVKAFQRRRFQCRIEDHVRLATLHADKSESGTAFHRFSVLVGDTHGKNGRMASVVNIIKDVHRQILDHLLREPESGKRRKGNLFKFKMRLFHTISSL